MHRILKDVLSTKYFSTSLKSRKMRFVSYCIRQDREPIYTEMADCEVDIKDVDFSIRPLFERNCYNNLCPAKFAHLIHHKGGYTIFLCLSCAMETQKTIIFGLQEEREWVYYDSIIYYDPRAGYSIKPAKRK